MWLGRVDVDAMLEEMTPEQFNEWIAAYRAGLLREQWETAGTIAAEIHNGFMSIRQGLGAKDITSKDYYDWTTYDPTQPPKKTRVDRDSIARFEKQVKRHGN